MINNEIILFFIYCIIGWICEVIYCSIPERKFINRGFLFGPYLPLYGFGAIAILFFLEPFTENIVLLFFLGVVITTVLEYITSFLLEKIFNIQLWDYSSYKLNINGRVCLLNSLLFGVLSIVLVYILDPFVTNIVSSLSETYQYYGAIVIVTVMIFDTANSVTNIKAFNIALEELMIRREEVKNKLSLNRKNGKEKLVKSITETWNVELIERKSRLAKRHKRIILAFPSMKSRSNFKNDNLIKLRNDFEELFEKGKKEYKEFKEKMKNLKDN